MRIRTVKPEFWASESNGRLSRDARLVFIGLLNLADDEGRLQGSPRFIAGQLFPYDDDGKKIVEKSLAELAKERKIVSYQADGASYLHVTGFASHQKVDKRYPSRLPPIPADSPRMPAETLEVAKTAPPTPPERPPLEWNGMEVEVYTEVEGEGGSVAAVAAPHPLQAVWNAHRVDPLPVWRETSKARKASADLRWSERNDWPEVVRRIASSAFCRGQNDRGWKASPDWLLRPDTAARVLEGKYDGGPPPKSKPGAPVSAESQDWSDVVDGQEVRL